MTLSLLLTDFMPVFATGIVFGATSGSYVLRIRYGSRRIWSVTISPQYIPMNQWFTLFFSWKKDSRLAVYIDGQERAQTSTVSSESRYSSSIPGNLTLGYIYSCSSPMTKAVGLFSRLAIWYALKDANGKFAWKVDRDLASQNSASVSIKRQDANNLENSCSNLV